MTLDARPSNGRMRRTVDGGYVYRGVRVRAVSGRYEVLLDGAWRPAKDQPAARHLVDRWMKQQS